MILFEAHKSVVVLSIVSVYSHSRDVFCQVPGCCCPEWPYLALCTLLMSNGMLGPFLDKHLGLTHFMLSKLCVA